MIQATATTNQLVERPPIVVVLGHIDHGKTTLLDNIRKSSVAEEESGGITQHIGAYYIEHNGKTIAFIDTPGHEAFTKMRSRGAKVADLAILVIAADDGVKPQTIEAINIIKETEIPFIVALNKIDKAGANPGKIKQQLSEQKIYVEDWGGKIPTQKISAKTGQGIEELLDLLLLVVDLEDLKADLEVPAQGIIIESHLDAKRGNVVTLLVKNGSLKVGDYIIADNVSGKIKLLEDFHGQTIKKASFLRPAVVVVGFEKLPQLGAEFKIFPEKGLLQQYLQGRQVKLEKTITTETQTSIAKDVKVLKVILKADRQGTLEAIEKSLSEKQVEGVKLEFLDNQVGDISENDIKLAHLAGSSIFAFKVKTSSQMKNLANQFGVSIKTFDVIYELSEAAEEEMMQLKEPKMVKEVLGRIKILATFKDANKYQIVGGKVTSGVIKKGARATIIRKDEIIGEGLIKQLQQNKVDAAEAQENSECGLMFVAGDSNVKAQVGDILEAFEQKINSPSFKL